MLLHDSFRSKRTMGKGLESFTEIKKFKQTKENERFKIVQTIFIVHKQFPNRL